MLEVSEEIEVKLNEQIHNELERLKASKPDASSKVEHTEYSDEPTDEAEIEVDPVLEQAIKEGYDPEYKGPNKKTPEEFVKDGSFFKKIKEQNKTIDELKAVVKDLADHNTKVEKAAYDRAVADLKRAKETAVLEADLIKVRALEAREEQLKAEQSAPKPVVNEAPKLTQELLDFQERNKSWFNRQTDENDEMVDAADFIANKIATQLKQRGLTMSQGEQLALVEKRIKEFYPKRFENENQDKKPLVVRSSTSTGGNASSGLADRLTAQQKDFVKKARTYGSKLTNEEYAKQLQLRGDLRDE